MPCPSCPKLTLPTIAIATALGMALMLFQMVAQANNQTTQTAFKIAFTLFVVFVSEPAMLIALRKYTIQIFMCAGIWYASGIAPLRWRVFF